jgi:hypothetical protein
MTGGGRRRGGAAGVAVPVRVYVAVATRLKTCDHSRFLFP